VEIFFEFLFELVVENTLGAPSPSHAKPASCRPLRAASFAR